jgi:ABC-type transport system substrate-binding protein
LEIVEDNHEGMSTRLRSRALLSLLATSALVVTGCGSGSGKSTTAVANTSAATSTATVLHIPFVDDMGVPDPDVFYGAEGLMVTNSVYDSLLQYDENSTKVIGDVAAPPTV